MSVGQGLIIVRHGKTGKETHTYVDKDLVGNYKDFELLDVRDSEDVVLQLKYSPQQQTGACGTPPTKHIYVIFREDNLSQFSSAVLSRLSPPGNEEEDFQSSPPRDEIDWLDWSR